MSSWRSNTSKKYNTCIKQWIKFCDKSNGDFQDATVKDGLGFLTNLFEHKKHYSTISCARSVLSLFINTGNNVEFGKQQIVQKYMKGIFHLRPSLPKYTFTWDVRKLLDYYRSQSNNNELDLKALTFKTTTLLTLLLCQRAQTAYWLDLKFIKVEEDKIEIAFPSLLKQTWPGKHLKPITLKSYKTDLKICPVNVLQSYIDKTKDFRRNETKLFIIFLKTHKPVGVKTLSRWIKESLKTADVNVDHYQRHSLSSAAASAAKSNGANISHLFLAGGWCNERTFAKFCNKPCNEIKQIPNFIIET